MVRLTVRTRTAVRHLSAAALGHPGGAFVLITLLIKLMDQMGGHYQETLKRFSHGRMRIMKLFYLQRFL